MIAVPQASSNIVFKKQRIPKTVSVQWPVKHICLQIQQNVLYL